MADKTKLNSILKDLGLADWQFHDRLGSTNDLALAWANSGARDWSLVLADEQTAGRGRAGRKWVTKPGSALAMSLVLRPTHGEQAHIPSFTALAALGLINALAKFELDAELKWPNDVLLAGKKVAGVLVEADWQGQRLDALVVGMGVNVFPGSVPPAEALKYPAVSVAEVSSQPLDRWVLLGSILREMMALRKILPGQDFMNSWNEALAFRGERAWFRKPGGEPHQIRLLGVGTDGALLYEKGEGGTASALAGEILMAYN